MHSWISLHSKVTGINSSASDTIMRKTASALVPPLLYNFYLFCQRLAFWVFMDLRNPRSDMSTIDRTGHCCNCPCSVHPVGTHGFRFPVTSDKCICFNLFIWQKRKNTLLLHLVVVPLPLFPSYFLVTWVIVPSISFLRTLTGWLKWYLHFIWGQKNPTRSPLPVSIKQPTKLP